MVHSFKRFYYKYILAAIRAIVLIVGALFFGGGCPDEPLGSGTGSSYPAPPKYFSITSLSDNSLLLEWKSESWSSNTSFKIERADSSLVYRQIGAADLTNLSFNDTDIDKRKVYYYRVRSVQDNVVGDASRVIMAVFSITANLVRTVPTGSSIHKILITPDGKNIVSTNNNDTEISVWNTDTWTVSTIPGNSGGVDAIALTLDSKYAVIGGYPNIKIRSLSDGNLVRVIAADSDRTAELALNNNGSTLITADDHGRLRLYQFSTGKLLQNLDSAKYGTWQLDADPFSDRVTACSYLAMKEWEIGSRFLRSSTFEHNTLPKYSPGGSYLAVNPTDSPSSLVLYRMSDWTLVFSSKYSAYAKSFSIDEKKLFIGDDNVIRILDVPSGKVLQSFTAHLNAVTALACFPDGVTFASGGWDKSIKIWSLTQTEQWHIAN
ncbi:MAG: hypothetical protein ACOYNS_04455 [Bacteroidota bacterium]